jgi:hypothetical protein
MLSAGETQMEDVGLLNEVKVWTSLLIFLVVVVPPLGREKK